ncbi:glycosyltransferase [Candidatus Parcubacteria bacterium]|nr:glycosyltransferase [Candidatus Parcubacteria bacterium]
MNKKNNHFFHMTLSPIILFTYNRPEHTKRTVKALQKNKLSKKSELYIFSDAPKDQCAQKSVQNVRNYIKSISNFKNITIIEREKNLGLAKSIISGVSEIINKHNKAIVLEDDLITSPFFLKYMNDALSLYVNDEQVMHISGYFFPNNKKLPDTFFYNQTSCWGWATWKRAWQCFEPSAKKLYEEIKKKNLMKKFNLDGCNEYFENQLILNINGKLKTWAIKWQASVFLKNGLCLHSNRSLVQNIGFDGSGINCSQNNEYDTKLSDKTIKIEKQILSENTQARKTAKKFYKKKTGLIRRIINKIKSRIKNKLI